MKHIITSLIAVGALFAIEHFAHLSYWPLALIKIILFLSPIAIFYFLYGQKIDFTVSKRIFWGICAGILFFAILLLAYALLSPYISSTTITSQLATIGVTGSSFLFVGLYIIFVNSFLEEVFFRGFIAKGIEHKPTAYLYSSFLFSFYHIGIFYTWFSLPIFLLCLFGLAAVGMLFIWLNEQSILPSWIAHACADAAIILIGLRMLI